MLKLKKKTNTKPQESKSDGVKVIDRKVLLNALMSVKPGISSKSIVESMTYFFFSGTHVVSYNDAISIAYPLKTDFISFIKADDLFKIVSKVKDDSLIFRMEGESLKMKSGKLESSFMTITDKEVMTRIDTVRKSLEGAKKIKLPDNFNECISLCSHVASSNESDQSLTCISIVGDQMYATDNKRIAHVVLSSSMEPMLLRAKEMKALLAINPIYYCVSKSWLYFISDSKCIFSIRRTNGEYPDMARFMEFTGVKITLPESIIDGVDIASVFSDDSDPSVNISIKNGFCRVHKQSNAGKVDFTEPVKYSGKDISFNIHHELLKEMMNHSTDIVVADSKAKLNTGNFTLVTSLYTEN